MGCRFTVSYSLSYLLNAPYANLGSRVGSIFCSSAVLSVVFASFCEPECSRLSLEEIDRLFESGVPLRKFKPVRLDLQTERDGRFPEKEEDKDKEEEQKEKEHAVKIQTRDVDSV